MEEGEPGDVSKGSGHVLIEVKGGVWSSSLSLIIVQNSKGLLCSVGKETSKKLYKLYYILYLGLQLGALSRLCKVQARLTNE